MSPVAVDVEREEKVDLRILDKGVPLVLGPEQKSAVVLTKYISNNPKHADWQPRGEWREQVVVDVARRGRPAIITVAGRDGEQRGVTIDDSLIIDLLGTFSGLVGIVPGQPPMNAEQVAEYEAAFEKPVQMYQKWDFRITQILKTNGAELRLNMARTEEQKKASAQSEMYQAFTEMFRSGMKALGEEAANASPKEVLAAGMLVKEAKGGK